MQCVLVIIAVFVDFEYYIQW